MVGIGNDGKVGKKRHERMLNFFYIQTVKLHKLVLQCCFRTMEIGDTSANLDVTNNNYMLTML